MSVQNLRARFEQKDTEPASSSKAGRSSEPVARFKDDGSSIAAELRKKWEMFQNGADDEASTSRPTTPAKSAIKSPGSRENHGRALTWQAGAEAAKMAVSKLMKSPSNTSLTSRTSSPGNNLTNYKCRLYTLARNPTTWKDAGSGIIAFKTNSLGKVYLEMSDTKSYKLMLKHGVHPLIELKPNPGSDRSWVWTVKDEAKPHLDADGNPTVQTFAIKFKQLQPAQDFFTHYNEHRQANAEIEKSERQLARQARKSKGHRNTRSDPPATIDEHSEEVVATEQGSSVESSAISTPNPNASRRVTGLTDDLSSEQLSKYVKPATPSNKNVRPVPAVSVSMPVLPENSVINPSPRKANTLGKKKMSSRKSKLVKMLGGELPTQILMEQEEQQYEATNDIAAEFPRRKVLPYIKRTATSFISAPVPASMTVDECESELRVLQKTEDLVSLERYVLKSMVARLEAENKHLQGLINARDSKAPKSEVKKMLAPILESNSYFYKQVTSVRLATENYRRSEQFKVPRKRKEYSDSVSINADPRLQSPVHRPSTIKQLIYANGLRNFTCLRDPPRDDAKVQKLSVKIIKVNTFRKNTPRILELDLTTCTLVIRKKRDDEESKEGSGDTFLRDITISADSMINAMPSEKNPHLLSFSFYLETDEGGPLFASLKGVQIKSWKVLFSSKDERDKYYRLLQIHMIGANASAGPRKSSTYMPTPVRFGQKVKFRVRQLPVQTLARELHQLWMWSRQEQGWYYGAQLNEPKHRHPALLPFDKLKTYQRLAYINLVTQLLATALTLGFVIEKQQEPDPDDDGFSTHNVGVIHRDVLRLVEFLAQNNHDTWAEQKMSDGWTVGDFDMEKQHDPFLVPYEQMPEQAKDTERNAAYKVLGSLMEKGYVIRKNPNGY